MKIFTFLVAMFITASVFAQTPMKMSYQAVIRNSSNALVVHTHVGMKISILQGSPTGTVVYTETQTPTTNANGLVSIEIGNGAGFSAIDWENGPYFIKTETDPAGGTNYTITGTSQLLSVPYALHANTAATITGGITETDPVYIGSEAANITATDIAKLSDLSGTNTGDQDLSGLATTTSVTTALAGKVDKITGKGLSTEDYTTTEKTKLAGTAAGAEVNVQADWNQSANTADDYIKNKPTIPPAQVQTNWTATAGMGVLLNKPAHIDEDKTDDVTITGNQTVAGNKSFTGTITVPTPVNATDAATKDYVDAVTLANSFAIASVLISKGIIVADVDGNIYSIVRIGSQVWMAENLKTTKYNDGASIPLVTDNTAWGKLNTPGYCWNNNDQANYGNTYGALYNWYTVNTGNLCPTGWHVPTDTEWAILTDYLGGWSVAGGKLKETGTTHWNNPNSGATNETGFTALPGGCRENNGTFNGIGNYGFWWSATEYSASHAYVRFMENGGGYVGMSLNFKKLGLFVRCVRD